MDNQETTKLKVLFVCHGNICRSPVAEYLFRRLVSRAELSDCIDVESAATSAEELGNPVYPLAKRTLAQRGIGCRDKVAQLLTSEMYDQSDYVVGMDSANMENIRRIAKNFDEKKTFRLLDFVAANGDGKQKRDIADPWYTRDFDKAWEDISLGCNAFLSYLQQNEQLRFEAIRQAAAQEAEEV